MLMKKSAKQQLSLVDTDETPWWSFYLKFLFHSKQWRISYRIHLKWLIPRGWNPNPVTSKENCCPQWSCKLPQNKNLHHKMLSKKWCFRWRDDIIYYTIVGSDGFKNSYFQPCLGKWSNLTNIFQMGWNHQLVYVMNPFVLRFWGLNPCLPSPAKMWGMPCIKVIGAPRWQNAYQKGGWRNPKSCQIVQLLRGQLFAR